MMENTTEMMGYGLSHWIAFTVMIVAFLYPIGRILSRMGLSPFWSIVAVIPVLNLIGLWVVAFIDWPQGEHSMRFRQPAE